MEVNKAFYDLLPHVWPIDGAERVASDSRTSSGCRSPRWLAGPLACRRSAPSLWSGVLLSSCRHLRLAAPRVRVDVLALLSMAYSQRWSWLAAAWWFGATGTSVRRAWTDVISPSCEGMGAVCTEKAVKLLEYLYFLIVISENYLEIYRYQFHMFWYWSRVFWYFPVLFSRYFVFFSPFDLNQWMVHIFFATTLKLVLGIMNLDL